MKIKLIISVMILIAGVGCDNKKTKKKPSNKALIKATLRNYVRAKARCDSDSLKAMVTTGDSKSQMVYNLQVENDSVSLKLKHKPTDNKTICNDFFKSNLTEEDVDDVKLEFKNDTAIGIIVKDNWNIPVKLIFEDGKWKIVNDSFLKFSAEKIEKLTKSLTAEAKSLNNELMTQLEKKLRGGLDMKKMSEINNMVKKLKPEVETDLDTIKKQLNE